MPRLSIKTGVCVCVHLLSENGYWLEWGAWSECTLTCGSGSTTRTRICVEPLHGGETCDGDNTEQDTCNTFECPGKCTHAAQINGFEWNFNTAKDDPGISQASPGLYVEFSRIVRVAL